MTGTLPGRPARTVSSPGEPRTRRLHVVAGGPTGPRSRRWTVAARGPADGPPLATGIVVTLEGARAGTGRTVVRAGRRLVLPAPPPRPVRLGAATVSPGPGWHVGAVLVVPVTAMAQDPWVPVPDGTHRVPAPPSRHHVQIVILLGDPDAIPLRLPPVQDAGALPLPGGHRLQLWSHHVHGSPWTAEGAAGAAIDPAERSEGHPSGARAAIDTVPVAIDGAVPST